MRSILRELVWSVPTLLVASLMIPGDALANEIPTNEKLNQLANSAAVSTGADLSDSSTTLQQVRQYSAEGRSAQLDQVTSVSQFSDVKPTDWAFQALQSLVERYGCIVGYPDKTYRGNRALSRYEFAAGLNACLDKIQELIAAATADFVRKEDLEVVKRLQEEFAAELGALRGRVESLEVRTATLEKQQFSTTTKLTGEVIFGIADTFGDRATRTGNDGFLSGVTAATENTLKDDQTQTIFTDRVRLNLRSSFTGKDLLWLRLNANNTTTFSGAFTGTNSTRTVFDGPTNPANSVNIDRAWYRFPVGTKLQVQISAVNHEYFDNLISLLNPFESSGQGTISRFGRANPLVFRSNNPGATGSFGVSFDYKLSPQLSLQGSYTADPASNDPSPKNGIFNGAYSALGQIVFRPSTQIDLGLTYARNFYPGGDANLTGSTGTGYAANPFATVGTAGSVLRTATVSDNFAAQLQWRLSRQFTVGGWFGYTKAYNRSSNEEATILNWAGFLGFPDLFKRGNLGGIIVGMQPRVTDSDFRPRLANGLPNPNLRRRLDEDPPIHVEGFYRYRVNDNISITPGVFVIFNPEGNSANNTQFVGVVRTTFSF